MRKIYQDTLASAVLILAMVLGWQVALTLPTHGETALAGVDSAEIFAVYEDFKEAQNARDPDAIGSFLVDGPQFLWVSDGRSYWGREEVVRRMSSFQRSEEWFVLPELDTAEVIALGDDTAILHMPLVLRIGQTGRANEIGFLVSIVFQEIDDTWKIAALLTTEDNRAN